MYSPRTLHICSWLNVTWKQCSVVVKFVGFSNSDVPLADVLSSIKAPIQPVGRYCIATGEMQLQEIYSCRRDTAAGDTAAREIQLQEDTTPGDIAAGEIQLQGMELQGG
jgi:hypothetical protein